MVEENQHPEVPPPAHVAGPPPQPAENPQVLYEHSDASFRWILGLLIVSALLGAVIFFAVLRFYYSYEDREAKAKRSHFPLATSRTRGVPEPRLEQINRMEKVEKGNVYLREETKEARLASYGPVGDGYVHIPIDRAMDLLADKLAARQEQPSEQQAKRQNGLLDAGEPNSGRIFRGPQP